MAERRARGYIRGVLGRCGCRPGRPGAHMTYLKLFVCALLGIAVASGLSGPGQARAAPPVPLQGPVINAFVIPDGVGNPWGSAIDRSGNVWLAEPGCDFAPTCPAEA